MFKVKFGIYKITLHAMLRLPDFFYSFLFTVVFPIYKALHKERAYGRVVQHLESARQYSARNANAIAHKANKDCAELAKTTARDVFKGIFWNALESYRGLARFKNIEKQIVFENEHIIRDAISECQAAGAPIAAISIHQGAFELMHRSLCRYSEHVHLITDSIGDTAFRDILKELRSAPHLTEYHPDETGRLIRELFRTKGILAMVVDQGKNTRGNEVTLFGRPSTLYLRLPQKVNEMGAGIVTFRTWTEYENSEKHDSHSRKKRIVIRFETYYPPQYDVTHKPPQISPNDNIAHSSSESMLVTAIAHEVETWIADHPEQWSWNYHGNFTSSC
ncbi:MAG: lauroyl acyltransferase [Fibrobacter sp.]|nr:lauroyl acyltransferase [Fibrobacter sp.]